MSELYEQARAAMQELVERAKLKKGQIVVVGCSTSEIMGARIGSSGTLEVAQEVLRGLREPVEAAGGVLAVQCCEHLNRALVLPRATHEVVTESNGSTMTNYESVVETKAGEPFSAYVLLWNNGDDGITTVEAKCDDAVIAQKIMAVNGGNWRVVELTLTVDQPGEHTITVGDLSKTINIIE